jgi:hypothetical protein
VCNKCHELEVGDYVGMRLMTVGLILICRREELNVTLYFYSDLYIFAVFTENVTFTSTVTFAMFVNSTVKFSHHCGKSFGVLRSLVSIVCGKSTNERQ